MSLTYHYVWWPTPDWKLDENGMVAQSIEELTADSLPIFTQLAREINATVRAKQEQAGLAVTPKWPGVKA